MTDEPGKDLAPRQPQPQPPAPPMDPEQLRQFQEFQRFQEYQRYQEATGQAPQAPKQPGGRRWWLVVLGSRIFWRALFFLLVVFSAMWAYNHFFGVDDPGDVAQDSGGVTGSAQGPRSPTGQQGTVGLFYNHVAHGNPALGCPLMVKEETQQKFAEAYGAADCTEAFAKLKSQVTSVAKYEQMAFPPDMMKTPTTTKITVDSCDLTVDGGPRLGTFVVEKVDSGWVITDWSPSTCG
ncbi:hypothetical protein [Lentzea sp. E54]|uniref:hypothetical protein n=1 Tax=Lentzea xerophila TaxID=3435883 RepID=UPI003DA5D862